MSRGRHGRTSERACPLGRRGKKATSTSYSREGGHSLRSRGTNVPPPTVGRGVTLFDRERRKQTRRGARACAVVSGVGTDDEEYRDIIFEVVGLR